MRVVKLEQHPLGLELNQKLATLLGWSNITELGGSLIGTPPAGMPQSRGQALVPDWMGDWAACGLLMARFAIYPDAKEVIKNYWGMYPDPEILGSAMRKTVVESAIQRLEASQAGLNMLRSLRESAPHPKNHTR